VPDASVRADTTVVASRTGLFLAEIERGGGAGSRHEQNLWTATVRTADGKQLYSISYPVPYDFPFPSIKVFEKDGSAVVVNAAEGWADWYGSGGVRRSRWFPFGEGPPDYERVLTVSAAAERAAFLISESNGGQQASLVLTDVRGTVERTFSLAGARAGAVHLSRDGQIVAAASYSFDGMTAALYTEILDGEGRLLSRLPVLMRRADIDPGARTILLTDGFDLFEGPVTSPVQVEFTVPPSSVVSDVRYAGPGYAVLVEEVRTSAAGVSYAHPVVLLSRAGRGFDDSLRVSGEFATSADLVVHSGTLSIVSGGRVLVTRTVR
jgi:hypothetical protein